MSFNTVFQPIKCPVTHQSAGKKLFFTACGSKVIVYLTTINSATGLPDQVLAECHLAQNEIPVNGQPVKALWQAPVMLTEGVDYALVLQCNDVATAMQTAQVGKANSNSAGQLVTATPALGPLTRITAAGAAAPIAGTVMRFEMLTVQYEAQEQTILLGTEDVVGATMLAVNAGAAAPEATARTTYLLELYDPAEAQVVDSYKVDAMQPVRLNKPFTGQVRVSATLRVGTNGLGAVLEPGTMLLVGALQPDGTYISPAIAATGKTQLQVIYEADLPSGSACAVHMQVDGQANWTLVPIDAAASGTNSVGVIEIHHKLTPINAAAVRVRLTPVGTPTARPYVRNLRAVVLP